MADQTELRMNLAAIKRVDPYARAIVDSSAHVAFYTFNATDTEWEKTDVEGAFFIYSRTAEPLYSIFINNRLNTNSLVEPIAGHLELQSQPPFLLYRNERNRIRGFWFYNRTECDRIGVLVDRLIREVSGAAGGGVLQAVPQAAAATTTAATATTVPILNNGAVNHANSSAAPSNSVSGQQPAKTKGSAAPAAAQAGNNGVITETLSAISGGGGGNGVDIFSMLSKAQEDFNNAQGGSGSTGIPGNHLNISNVSNSSSSAAAAAVSAATAAAVAAASAASSASAPASANDVPSQSVRNFFAAAVPATAKEVPKFQRLLSQPMSVEQLEKQQQQQKNQQQSNVLSVAEKLNVTGGGKQIVSEYAEKQRQTETGGGGKRVTPQPRQKSAAATDEIVAQTALDNGIGFVRIASPAAAAQPSQQSRQRPLGEELAGGASPLAAFINSNYLVAAAVRPSGKLPGAATAAAVDVAQQQHQQHQNQPLQQLLLRRTDAQTHSNQNTPGKPALMLPTMFTPNAASATGDLTDDLLRLHILSNSGNVGGSGGSGSLTTPLQMQLGAAPPTPTVPATMMTTTTMTNSVTLDNLVRNHNNSNNSNNNNINNPHHPQQHVYNAAVDKPEPLTQSQLLQAMNYLIRNDPEFVRKLHEAYLKSFTEMVSL